MRDGSQWTREVGRLEYDDRYEGFCEETIGIDCVSIYSGNWLGV